MIGRPPEPVLRSLYERDKEACIYGMVTALNVHTSYAIDTHML